LKLTIFVLRPAKIAAANTTPSEVASDKPAIAKVAIGQLGLLEADIYEGFPDGKDTPQNLLCKIMTANISGNLLVLYNRLCVVY
jgi:hypothetical protein